MIPHFCTVLATSFAGESNIREFPPLVTLADQLDKSSASTYPFTLCLLRPKNGIQDILFTPCGGQFRNDYPANTTIQVNVLSLNFPEMGLEWWPIPPTVPSPAYLKPLVLTSDADSWKMV